MVRKILWHSLVPNNDEDNLETESENNEHLPPGLTNLLRTNCVTPFGVFEYDSPLNPLENNDCYLAETNFDITPEMVLEICKVPGVDTVRVISRYTIALIIGSLFDSETVINDIDNLLQIDTNDKISISDINEYEKDVIEKLSNHTYWLAYVFPNGKTYSKVFDSEKDLLDNVESFFTLKDMSAGNFISSINVDNLLNESSDESNL